MNARTHFAQHPLGTGAAPEWASEWGEDRFGVFAGFEVGGVTQIMRWIPQGSFTMGSPVDEPERWDGESPQHRVMFHSGFWLADTACTQELWRVVMGDAPSRFEGNIRPVERVSWHEVERFFVLVNEAVPGLDLSLPSEAQWEYACRAGTTTAFNFGDVIDATRANFERNYPFDRGDQGARPETVNVATFAPNSWGLHEMHGNVWEWCQDMFHPDYRGAPDDGTAWLETGGKRRRGAKDTRGAGRVLRGGSWDDSARSCRSAYRDADDPDARGSDIGFRCARVQA